MKIPTSESKKKEQFVAGVEAVAWEEGVTRT
jgi:hypothetical protein